MLTPNTPLSLRKMEINTSKTSSAALLNCGTQQGLREKLLLKPKPTGPLTERVPRSNVLERLHSFLPQMAEANEKLRRQMEDASPGQFDIENVVEAPRVIEMDVALVELDGSDAGGSGDETEDSDSASDTDTEGEVTESNIKLPGGKKRNAQIQVLQETEEKE